MFRIGSVRPARKLKVVSWLDWIARLWLEILLRLVHEVFTDRRFVLLFVFVICKQAFELTHNLFVSVYHLSVDRLFPPWYLLV